MYYLQSRYYDPAIGRFINADSPNFALTNPYSDGITDKNYFAYCDNNPISRGDDGGEFWSELLTGVAVAAGVTAVAAVAVATGGISIRVMAVAGGGAALSVSIASAGATAMAVSAGAVAISVGTAMYAKSAAKYGKSANAKVQKKEDDNPDPYGRAGQKKQGRERKEKKKREMERKPKQKSAATKETYSGT